MAEMKETLLEGAGEEAPPPYHDIVGWMAAHGLETEGVDSDDELDEGKGGKKDGTATHDTPPIYQFPQTSPPLIVAEMKKPCINHCGTA